MTARDSQRGAASYELESSWAEDVNTYGTRLQPHGDPVVPSDIQQRIAEQITKQYANEGKLGVRGPWQGQFSIVLALTGHGGTTTGGGALTATDVYNLLVNAIGGGSAAQVATAVAASSASASSVEVDAGNTINDNGLMRIGAQGDSRGGGQFAAVDNLTGTTLSLLTAIGGTPDDGDLLYAPLLVYPMESAGVAIVPTRWLLQTANGQVSAHGCYPMEVAISGNNHGEQMTVTLTYGVSRWAERNETFPNLTTTDAKDASIVAGGSFHIQDVGTATRQALNLRQWELTLSLQVAPIMGPGGVDAYQITTGAVRTGMSAALGVTIDSEASGSSVLRDIYTGTALQQILITSTIVDGKALGFYFPNCRMTGYPNQVAVDNLNRVSANFEALTGPDRTTEASAASFVIGMA